MTIPLYMPRPPLRLVIPPSPPACPPISAGCLKAGDVIVQHGTAWVGQTIEEMTKSPWSHAAMVLEDPGGVMYIAEMCWPRCKRTIMSAWLADNEAWVYPLADRLNTVQTVALWAWWQKHLDKPYDVLELLRIGDWITWTKICIFLHLPAPRPPHGNGVCSVFVAMALKSIGLIDVDPFGVTPATVPDLTCVGAVRKVTTP